MDRFIRKLTTTPKYKQKAASYHIGNFRVPLTCIAEQDTCLGVPLLVTNICNFLLSHGSEIEGIFRINGSARLIESMRNEFDQTAAMDLHPCNNSYIYAVAGVLKLFLRELPGGLIPERHTIKLFNMACLNHQSEDVNLFVSEVLDILVHLPPENVRLLKYLCNFLCQLSEKEQENKMSNQGFGIIFGPCIFRFSFDSQGFKNQSLANQLMSTFIQYNELIFGQIEVSPVKMHNLVKDGSVEAWCATVPGIQGSSASPKSLTTTNVLRGVVPLKEVELTGWRKEIKAGPPLSSIATSCSTTFDFNHFQQTPVGQPSSPLNELGDATQGLPCSTSTAPVTPTGRLPCARNHQRHSRCGLRRQNPLGYREHTPRLVACHALHEGAARPAVPAAQGVRSGKPEQAKALSVDTASWETVSVESGGAEKPMATTIQLSPSCSRSLPQTNVWQKVSKVQKSMSESSLEGLTHLTTETFILSQPPRSNQARKSSNIPGKGRPRLTTFSKNETVNPPLFDGLSKCTADHQTTYAQRRPSLPLPSISHMPEKGEDTKEQRLGRQKIFTGLPPRLHSSVSPSHRVNSFAPEYNDNETKPTGASLTVSSAASGPNRGPLTTRSQSLDRTCIGQQAYLSRTTVPREAGISADHQMSDTPSRIPKRCSFPTVTRSASRENPPGVADLVTGVPHQVVITSVPSRVAASQSTSGLVSSSLTCGRLSLDGSASSVHPADSSLPPTHPEKRSSLTLPVPHTCPDTEVHPPESSCDPTDYQLSAEDQLEEVDRLSMSNAVEDLQNTYDILIAVLRQQRMKRRRGDDLAAMTSVQIAQEKTDLQKGLLYYEHLHGRPSGFYARQIMKPLYDRYRQVKRMLRSQPVKLKHTGPSGNKNSHVPGLNTGLDALGDQAVASSRARLSAVPHPTPAEVHARRERAASWSCSFSRTRGSRLEPSRVCRLSRWQSIPSSHNSRNRLIHDTKTVSLLPHHRL